MKNLVFIVSLLVVSNALANNDPTALFDTKDNYTNQSTITWRYVSDLQKACETESRKRGYKGFGYALNACSFFDGNQCLIITEKKVSMHTLGHEVRHCFQGNWH